MASCAYENRRLHTLRVCVVSGVQGRRTFGAVSIEEVCSGSVVHLLSEVVLHVRGSVQLRAASVLGLILSHSDLRRWVFPPPPPSPLPPPSGHPH